MPSRFMFQCQQNNGCTVMAWPLNITRRAPLLFQGNGTINRVTVCFCFACWSLACDLCSIQPFFGHNSLCQSLYLPLFVFDVIAFLPLLVGICGNCWDGIIPSNLPEFGRQMPGHVCLHCICLQLSWRFMLQPRCVCVHSSCHIPLKLSKLLQFSIYSLIWAKRKRPKQKLPESLTFLLE